MKVLILNTALDYVHDCIPEAAACVAAIAKGLKVESVVSSNVSDWFRDIETLSQFAAIVFNNNSGDLFDEDEKKVFQAYIAAGHGVMGVHAATASFLSGEDASGATVMSTTYPFYSDMWGASFTDHPPLQDGSVLVDTEACARLGINLPQEYQTNDEWYNYDRNVCENENVTVLARAKVSTIDGNKMGDQHPLVWHQEFSKSRVFYTALGHHPEAYKSDEKIIGVLRGGLKWCLKMSS